MTNYTRITTKDCEALAEFLTRILGYYCENCPAYEVCKDEIFIHETSEELRNICKKNIMAWLNKESKFDDYLCGDNV